MSSYIRPRVTGATIFFTVCLLQRGDTLLTDHIELLREAVRVTRARRPFAIDAWVVLPDHMYAIWTLPAQDGNYSDRWGSIKARFSREVRRSLRAEVDCKSTLRPRPTGRVDFQSTAPPEPGANASPLPMRRDTVAARRGEAGIWQRRFWEHHIRNRADYDLHMRKCWFSPVEQGLVDRPEDWPYSSLHRDLRRHGTRPPDPPGSSAQYHLATGGRLISTALAS